MTEIKFNDFSSEKYRTYVWAGYSVITINEPVALNVSKSGGHRILDSKGVSHYIPSGCIHLYWEVKEGNDHFVL